MRFIWTCLTTTESRSQLPSHLHRYEQQVQEHLSYLNFKIAELNGDLEKAAGGILDSRDEAVDLRDRLQRELDARELPS